MLRLRLLGGAVAVLCVAFYVALCVAALCVAGVALAHTNFRFVAGVAIGDIPKLLKLPPKVVSESCFPKLFFKIAPQSCRFSKQLFINAPTKPQSCSPQLLPKAALQSCYRKPRPKEAPPKLQSCSPKLPQSWSQASFLSYATAPQQLNACWGDFPGKSTQLNARFWIGRGEFAISEY